MLNKSKLNLTVILLVIGIGFVPTGLFINGHMRDQIASEVSSILTSIEDEVVTKFETEYLGLGITEVLPAIYDDQIEGIEIDYARFDGIPPTLHFIKNRTLEMLPLFINASRAAVALNYTIYRIMKDNSTTEAFAINALFNNYTFQNNFSSPIEGISEFMTGEIYSLNYTFSTIYRLLHGYEIDDVVYPGLITELELGSGLSNWLQFYYNAKANISNYRTLIQSVYACTWSSGQLQNLSRYITSYLWEIVVKAEYTPTYTLEEYAELFFYDQWANVSMRFGGINLRWIAPEEILGGLWGWEVGRANPINISYYSAVNLWDSLNGSSFINESGIQKWIDAAAGNSTIADELKTIFKLNDESIARIFTWLTITIRINILPAVYSLPPPTGIGMLIGDYADILYLQQWANGTRNEEGLAFDYFESQIVRPNGDAGVLWSFPLSGNHYEHIDEIVSQPNEGTADNIATGFGDDGESETFDMETISLPATGTVSEIEVWIYGYDVYGTDNMTVDINMNVWQGAQIVPMANESAWYSVIFPIDAANGTNAHLDDLQVRFTAGANVDGILNHYILAMYAKVTYEVIVRGFEVGIPIKTNISLNTAFDLLDTSNDSSFIHRNGILNWIEAFEGNVSAQTEIMTLFNLDLTQLNMLTNWLFTSFRFDFMPAVAYDLTRNTMTTFAQSEFFRQWSDGDLFKNGIEAGPALGLDSIIGWELGIPTKTNIDETISQTLWGYTSIADPLRAEKVANSLVNRKGISNWFKAIERGDYYNILQNLFTLTNNQMDAILTWLVRIRETFALPIAQIKYNLPVDHYTFGDLFFMGFLITGGIFGGLGVLGAILIAISKRK